MRFSIAAIVSTIAATAVMAAPMVNLKRGIPENNLKVLNFALTLEHLETAFYTLGLEKFDLKAFEAAGLDGRIREQFIGIREHEHTHVETLQSIIKSANGVPVPSCKYSFPLDNVHSFLAISRAFETTGVSAILGAIANFQGDLLTDIASVVTVEGRQSSFVNEVTGLEGAPYPFDTPLDAREAFTLASQFIVSCPFQLDVVPFTKLTAALPDSDSKIVKFSFDGESSYKKTWCQFLFSNKVVVLPSEKCTIPSSAIGYFYLVITNTATPITLNDDSHILAGPALLFNGSH
ncbi:hypothetical protein BGZ46_007302 [Entomortierella lignicola]|nr:hypothetical protein BGZ46_007302 [Entomortierella lignicola]